MGQLFAVLAEVLERNLVHLHRVHVAAGHRVHVLLHPHLVDGDHAGLQHLRVEVRAGRHVAAVQVGHVVAAVDLRPLKGLNQLAVYLLLQPYRPGRNRVASELDGLLLDVVEGRLAGHLNQVGRHTEDAADFLRLELARLDELSLVGRDGQRLVLHAVAQQLHACVAALLPRLRKLGELLLLHRLLGGEDAGRPCTVAKVVGAVVLHRLRQAEVFPVRAQRAHAPVVGQLQHVLRPHDAQVLHDVHFLACDDLRLDVIVVEDVELRGVAAVVAGDHGVAHAVHERLGVERLPELVRGLVAVGLVPAQVKCRMTFGQGHLAPAALVDVEGE